MTSSIDIVAPTPPLEKKLTKQLSPKVLLIEHDHYLSNAFLATGNQLDYQVSCMPTTESEGTRLSGYLLDNTPDMIVLDVGLVDNSMALMIRNLRSLYHGLLVIVSSKNSEQEQVDAFYLGVDDYLTRPVDSRILMMRIAALFRRRDDKCKKIELVTLTLGDVCLLPKSQKCFINGDAVKLTTFEFNLLTLLVEQQGNILSRDKLYSILLGRIYNGTERTLDVRMSQLREKLTLAGMKKNQIETVWGQGYMFNNTKA